jgi:hypothetical protein
MFTRQNRVLAAYATAALLGFSIIAPSFAATQAQVSISSAKTALSKSFVQGEILRQARLQGVALTADEAQGAAAQAVDQLTGKGPGPQKLIILLKFKKFTICISTGKDKDFCKKKSVAPIGGLSAAKR